MGDEVREFAEALCRHVAQELVGQEGEYVTSAVKIVDARNHLFRTFPEGVTDEAADTYALRDLCHLADDMEIVPDMNRALGVARNFFG